MGEDLRKSVDHIQNSVAGVSSNLLMLYLLENRQFICVVKIRLMESSLLAVQMGSLNGSGQVLALR
jgi:hypothetical protein